jgi:hypothetical protein
LAITNPPLTLLLNAVSINANTFVMAVSRIAKSRILDEINKALKDALGSVIPFDYGLGAPFSNILRQTRTYIDAHLQAHELIFLSLSHANFDDTVATQTSKLVAQTLAPENLPHYRYPNGMGAATLDSPSLVSRTLTSLVGNTTKILLPG